MIKLQLQWWTNSTWSIEPRHFQCPWTTPDPDFKVRSFFDV